MPPTPRLAQEVLRTHTAAYSISVLKRHKTPVNLFLAFSAVPSTTASRFEPGMCFKTAQDPRHFVFGVFGGSAGDRIAH